MNSSEESAKLLTPQLYVGDRIDGEPYMVDPTENNLILITSDDPLDSPAKLLLAELTKQCLDDKYTDVALLQWTDDPIFRGHENADQLTAGAHWLGYDVAEVILGDIASFRSTTKWEDLEEREENAVCVAVGDLDRAFADRSVYSGFAKLLTDARGCGVHAIGVMRQKPTASIPLSNYLQLHVRNDTYDPAAATVVATAGFVAGRGDPAQSREEIIVRL